MSEQQAIGLWLMLGGWTVFWFALGVGIRRVRDWVRNGNRRKK